jgi:hypothetical protein
MASWWFSRVGAGAKQRRYRYYTGENDLDAVPVKNIFQALSLFVKTTSRLAIQVDEAARRRYCGQATSTHCNFCNVIGVSSAVFTIGGLSLSPMAPHDPIEFAPQVHP